MWAHFRAWEVGPRPYAGRIRPPDHPPFRLQSCLYWPGDGRGLARPSQKRNLKNKYAKSVSCELKYLSSRHTLVHIPTNPNPGNPYRTRFACRPTDISALSEPIGEVSIVPPAGMKHATPGRLGAATKGILEGVNPFASRTFLGAACGGGARGVCGGVRVRSANQLKVTRWKLFVFARSKFPSIQTTPQSRYFVR
jgi:hypothetical protein